jgi:hypothetical protein
MTTILAITLWVLAGLLVARACSLNHLEQDE